MPHRKFTKYIFSAMNCC